MSLSMPSWPAALAAGAAAFSLLAMPVRAANPVPDSVYEPLRMEAGTWDAEVTFFENGQPSGSAKGVQVNTLLVNGHWIVNDFRIPAMAKLPAYQGIGTWGWDPVAKHYVNTWVDTNDRSVRIDHGYWHAPEQTMIWSSKVNDGEGHSVDYRATEEFKGDTRIFSFFQLGIVKPNAHPLVRIVFTKRPATQAGAASGLTPG